MADFSSSSGAGIRDAAAAHALALAAASRAAAFTVAALRAAPGAPSTDADRARIVAARSRIRTLPPAGVIRFADELADRARRRSDASRAAFALLDLARSEHAAGVGYVRAGRVRPRLSAAERAELLEGHDPTDDQLAVIDREGVGPSAVLALGAAALDDAEKVVRANLDEAVRLDIVSEVVRFAARSRQRPADEASLDVVRDRTRERADELQDELARLHRSLRARRGDPQSIAVFADAGVARARRTLRALVSDAVGLDAWIQDGADRLRFRADVNEVSVEVGVAIRTALLVIAADSVVAAAFAAGGGSVADAWRSAARSRPLGSRRVLASAPESSLTRVRGLIEAVEDLQVNAGKRVSFLRVRTTNGVRTVAILYFNPRYVGLRPGTSVDLRVSPRPDVLAEFVNRSTTRRLDELATAWGSRAGGVLDRRDLAAEAERSWIVGVVREVRPVFDALPSSINGSWSLGAWASIAASAGTVS